MLVPLVSCIGEDSLVEVESMMPLATLASSTQIPLQSPTQIAFVAVEPEPVHTPIPQPSATATSVPLTPTSTPAIPVLLQANTTTVPFVCNQLESYINIQQETNNVSWRLMDFVFEAEDVITFLMWSDRPYPESSPTPAITPIPEGGGPPYPLGELNQSRRVLLKGQMWNWESGVLVEIPVTTESAIQTPCADNCPVDVVSIAPDESWQLLQITEAFAEYRGLWLVSEEAMFNVVPYVPVTSQWQWSDDSDMLWITYTLQDIDGETYGAESAVVDLTISSSPQLLFRSWGEIGYQWQSPPNLLSPDEYTLVFSPVDKVVLLYEHKVSFSLTPPDNPLDVYIMDVTQNPPQLLDTYKASYPFLIDWSDTLQDFVILEFSTTGAIIYTLNTDIVYEIPMGVLKNINLDFVRRVAISPAQKNIVLMTSTNAWAYSCLD